jgi:hypothetical protein
MAMEEGQATRTDIGQTDLPDSALLNEIGKPVEKRTLLPRGVTGRAPVQLDPIHAAMQSSLTRQECLDQPAPP